MPGEGWDCGHMSRSRSPWGRTELPVLGGGWTRGPSNPLTPEFHGPVCHRAKRPLPWPHANPPHTTIIPRPLCCPHLEHSITHHTIPHLASPLSGPPWAGPGVPLGSEAPKFLWGCMHFCINLPSRIHTGSEQSLAEGAGGWGGVTSE